MRREAVLHQLGPLLLSELYWTTKEGGLEVADDEEEEGKKGAPLSLAHLTLSCVKMLLEGK
jgi:hypothetical protein